MPSIVCEPGNVADTQPFTPDNGMEAPQTIRTTLYDLLAAIHDTVGPEDDNLSVAIVTHLLRSGRVTWLGDPDIFAGWD